MRWLISIGAAVIILAAIGAYFGGLIPRTPGHALRTAKAQVAARMRDPASVQFKDVSVSTTGGRVCGSVNAKNGYGAYVGFTPFIWLGSGEILTYEAEPTFDEIMDAISNAIRHGGSFTDTADEYIAKERAACVFARVYSYCPQLAPAHAKTVRAEADSLCGMADKHATLNAGTRYNGQRY